MREIMFNSSFYTFLMEMKLHHLWKGGVSSGSERKELIFLARGFFLTCSIPPEDWWVFAGAK